MRISGSIWALKDLIYYGVYVSHDTEPNHLGQMLNNHYNTLERAIGLISMGSALYVGPRIDCPPGHSFSSPVIDRSVFWARDMGLNPTFMKRTLYTDVRMSARNVYIFDGQLWGKTTIHKKEYTWINPKPTN